MKSDPNVAFRIHSTFPRNRVFHEDRVFVDLPRRRVDPAHLVHGVLDKPDLVITRYRHAIRAGGSSPLDAGRNLKDSKLPGCGIQSNHLIGGDGVQPNASVRVHAHGVATGRAAFKFGELVDIELFGLRIDAQPSPVGTAIYEPKLTVRRAVNSVQTIGWRLPGGGRNLCVAKSFGVEAAELAAYSLGDRVVQPCYSAVHIRRLYIW